MNNNIAYFVTRMLLALDAGSNRSNEEGSQTTDNLLWILAVIALALAATGAVAAYGAGLIGRIG